MSVEALILIPNLMQGSGIKEEVSRDCTGYDGRE